MKLKIFDIKWSITTAGPSPENNQRTELFLYGCKKALVNPCAGCFNQQLWDNSKCHREYSPKDTASIINRNAPNKYISISGGEPTDQFPALIKLCKYLKKYGFHILVYTYHDLYVYINKANIKRHVSKLLTVKEKIEFLYRSKMFLKLIKYVNIVVDGTYNEAQRIYQTEKNDGITNSIGSCNQRMFINNLSGNSSQWWLTCEPPINWQYYFETNSIRFLQS